jgi:hypothetical protein
MKKIFIQAIVLGGLALSGTGCEKYFDGVNDNPNDITSAEPNLLVPAVEAHIAYGLQGDISRLTSMLMQQCTGTDRQWLTYQVYNISETDTDNFWRFNLYGGPMQDLHILMKNANAAGYGHYEGIGKVLMAYCLMNATDLFGDIPYSQAFEGADNTAPTYDSQETIYGDIQTLLSDAKTLFSGDGGAVLPGAEDLIYGGDVSKWTALADLLSARGHLHLAKLDASHYNDVLSILDAGGFTSSADDAVYRFGSTETSAGPWYQFNDQRGDISFTGWMLDTMLVMADPRLDQWVDTSGGGAAMGPYFGSSDAPYEYGSYVEQKFMEAEAAFGTGDAARAANAHNAAVMASLAKLGVAGVNPAFESAEANETSGTITLEKIMVQKYIALFTSNEVFTDWRRTGFPNLQAVPDNITGGIIPRRLPNPQSERLYNPNAPAAPAITTKVWWDN